MSATTSDIVQRPATGWSTEKKKGGSAAVTGTDFAAATTVNEALDICSTAWKAEHVITTRKTGKATSVLT